MPKAHIQARIKVEPAHLEIVREILAQLAPDREVWAFGSRVRGSPKPYSDLDLAIITTSPLPLAQSAALTDAFEESELPWRVDLVDWSTISHSFRQIIQAHHVVLHPASP